MAPGGASTRVAWGLPQEGRPGPASVHPYPTRRVPVAPIPEDEKALRRSAARQPSFSPSGLPARVLGVFLLLVVLGSGAAAEAVLVTDRPATEDAAVADLFARMTSAWRAGDARAAADLVHPDGLAVTSGPNADRRTHYSPAQAYYYFKNLFQSQETVAFGFDKIQGGGDSPRAHGMATWTRRRPGQEREQVIRLMCVLGRAGDRWMLTEIHTIR